MLIIYGTPEWTKCLIIILGRSTSVAKMRMAWQPPYQTWRTEGAGKKYCKYDGSYRYPVTTSQSIVNSRQMTLKIQTSCDNDCTSVMVGQKKYRIYVKRTGNSTGSITYIIYYIIINATINNKAHSTRVQIMDILCQ